MNRDIRSIASNADDEIDEVIARTREYLLSQKTDRTLQRSDIVSALHEVSPLASRALVDAIVAQVETELYGAGPLQKFFDDNDVSDVLVQANKPVWIERCGQLQRTDFQLSETQVLRLIERIVGPLGLRIDRASPIVDARLSDGSRVNAIIAPLAIDGPCLTIRRFSRKPVFLSEFASPEVERLLVNAVQARCNILVSGGTGAGKTTALNSLALHIRETERVITIEDAAELRLGLEHCVRLESRPANSEGVGLVTIRDLVRNALRMRPDRIIVGEVRGAEALDMIQAMNTGHEGSLSTCHANSADDALRRLETMVLMSELALPLHAIRQQIASSIDLIVHITRGRDGTRSITEVSEVRNEEDNVKAVCIATHDKVVGTCIRQRCREIVRVA